MEKINNNKASKQKLSSVFDFTGLILSGASLLALTINVNNWANIAKGSNYAGGAGGSVGTDLPLTYLIALSFLFVLMSYLTNRRFTKIKLISITILLSITIIWGFALGFDSQNPYQSLID